MNRLLALSTLLFVVSVHGAVAQSDQSPRPALSAERIDSAAVQQIINEEMNRSNVMDILSWLADVCGARLTMSPGHKKAMDWAIATLKEWGLENVHKEAWGPFGRGWYVKRFATNVIDPIPFPLLAYPKAWSPGTDGILKGDVVYFDAKTDSAMNTYRGTLKGKIVLLGDPRAITAHFEPQAARESDSSLLAKANADPALPRRGKRSLEGTPEARRLLRLESRKFTMCVDEGAAAVLSPSRGDGGTIFVQSASLPLGSGDTVVALRPHAYDAKPPETIPQLAVAAEHYNRLVRMLHKKQRIHIEVNLEVAFTREDSAYNVIAELPGTDLKDEIVMIGGHLDSWHAGTGATDNGTGIASSMEAMRIIRKLGLKPRRTIRIALWSGEEQGLLGSRAYVRAHFGQREPDSTRGASTRGAPTLKPEAGRFSVYLNHDNGTGKVRGVYMQGNEAVRPVFRAWLGPFRMMGSSTISPLSTGSTDHVSFDEIGLPGFQWIQDPIEYESRTHHSNMDVYDRALEEDLKQSASVMASSAYNAAMRNEKIPRKPVR